MIGAASSGVDLAVRLAETARNALPGEFRRFDPAKARVMLAEGSDRVLPPYPPELSEKARLQLERLGVTVWLGKTLTGADAEGVTMGAERLQAKTVPWAARGAPPPPPPPLRAPPAP